MILVSYCKTVKGVDEARERREEMIGRDDGTAGAFTFQITLPFCLDFLKFTI